MTFINSCTSLIESLVPTLSKAINKPKPHQHHGNWKDINFGFSFFYHFAPIRVNSKSIIVDYGC